MLRITPINILCVDDNELMMKIYEIAFRGWYGGHCFTMSGCTNMQQLKNIEADTYDIAILDYHYKGENYNGLDIESYIRDQGYFSGKTIFVSSCSLTVKGLKEKGYCAISKPINIDRIKDLCINLIYNQDTSDIVAELNTYDIKVRVPKF